MINLPTFVLSLTSANDRRASISSRLDGIVPFQLFDALTPIELESSMAERGRLTAGEYCCAKSHSAIANLASCHDVSLVMEDDALLTNDFSAVLVDLVRALRAKEVDADVVIVGYSKVPHEDRRRIGYFNPISAEYRLPCGAKVGEPYRQWPCGTVAYLLTRRGALRLAAATQQIDGTADDWAMLVRKGLVVKHCQPLIVLEDYRVFKSAIEAERQNFTENNALLDPIRYGRGALRALGLMFRGLRRK